MANLHIAGTTEIDDSNIFLNKLKNIKFDSLWSGTCNSGSTITLPTTYKDYDILMFHVTNTWNRNSWIIMTKFDYGKNTAFSGFIYSGGATDTYISSYSLPKVTPTNGTLTIVAGIKFS